jgi:hypothetical protein
MKILRKAKVGCCLMTGIKAHNRFLGYSTNPGLTDPASGPRDGTNRMTERFFGKADRGWILYGLRSKSRNRFIGYCVVEEGAAEK